MESWGMKSAGSANAPSVSGEFLKAQFGDVRLTKRAIRFAESALRRPESSIPRMAGGTDGAEGLYRFLANERVTPERIIDPHFAESRERARAAGAVLLVHDTTTFSYGEETKRTGLGPICRGALGFLDHVTLAVAEQSGRALGIVAHRPYVRPAASESRQALTAQEKVNKVSRKSQLDADNESLRWQEQAIEAGRELGDIARVHVCDREADDYKFLGALHDAGEHFVVRVAQDRATSEGVRLFTKMNGMVAQMCREVRISAQGKQPGPKQRARHPPRESRMAKLQMSSGSFQLVRPGRSPCTAPKSLALNFVLVEETEAPEGCTPVQWRLTTTLPVSTAEEIARVVDIYRKRWTIEEFFKALKTGCGFNQHQIESYDGLVKLLALLLPVAWKLLEMRTQVRETPDAPATVVLTKRQVAVLVALHNRAHPKAPLPPKPSVKQAIYAIAGLAGHFKQNGDPGWQTLGEGLRRLLQAEEDAVALRDAVRN